MSTSERRDANRAEHPAIAPRALAPDPGVAQDRRHADRGRGQQQDHDGEGRAKGEAALRELSRPVLEQEFEKFLRTSAS